MIPKVIHYCWLSGDCLPEHIKECIDSWHRFLPEYEFRCWDSNSVNRIESHFFNDAFRNKKWAFASDYIRLYALYNEGGIYLDSDVMAFGSLDDMLCNEFFSGLEMRDREHTQIFIEAAVMGAEKGNLFVKKCLEEYDGRSFIKEDGTFDLTPIPTVISPIMEKMYGWQRKDVTQSLGGATIYSTRVIANSNCELVDSVKLYHLNQRSWIPLTLKERIIKLLRRFRFGRISFFFK